MANQRDLVLETLSNPELIQQGDVDTLLAIRFYERSPLTRKYLVVVYKEINRTDGFVLTAPKEEDHMEALKVLEGKPKLDWEYDEEADVLYISVGKPRPAVGVDIGEGVIVRWDEHKREIVGLTIIGLRARLTEGVEKKLKRR